MSLPPERVPFPVAPSYRVRPDMRRWPDEDRGHLRLDARYPTYLAEKLRLLGSDPDGCRVLAPDADRGALERALLHAAEALAEEPGGQGGAPTPGGALDGEQGGGALAGHLEAAPRPPVAVRLDPERLHFPLLGVSLLRDGLELATAGPVPGASPVSRAGPGAAEGSGPGVNAGPSASLAPPGPSGPAAGPERLPELARRARVHLAGLPPLERLADALALSVQEDLVVMGLGAGAAPGAGAGAGAGTHAAAGDDGASSTHRSGTASTGGPAAGSAELLHVCFPSGWDPATRAGADFATLHGPVPHGETLRRAAPQVVRAMVSKGPFVRYVWSLVPGPELDRNPRRRADLRRTVPPEALWFRVERQTVMPLPEQRRALFTIRVYMAPLAEVLTGPERRATLASAIASMDDALLAYKGIGRGRDALLAWLGRDATAW